jgi:hypothetical protein
MIKDIFDSTRMSTPLVLAQDNIPDIFLPLPLVPIDPDMDCTGVLVP